MQYTTLMTKTSNVIYPTKSNPRRYLGVAYYAVGLSWYVVGSDRAYPTQAAAKAAIKAAQ